MSFFRDNFDGKKVIKLEYEAYTPMAKKKLKELCNRLRVKWPDLYHIAIYHRHCTYIRTVRQGSNVGLYRTSLPVRKSGKFSKSGLSGN